MSGPLHTTIYVFISNGNSKTTGDAIGSTLSPDNGWAYRDVRMSTVSFGSISGFREYEREAPATVTLNTKVELPIAMKVHVLTCAAEQQ